MNISRKVLSIDGNTNHGRINELLEQVLQSDYGAQIKNRSTIEMDELKGSFYIDFSCKEAISSNQFDEIESKIRDLLQTNSTPYFTLVGISVSEVGQRINYKWFLDQNQLDLYLKEVEESQQSDHKFLGRSLGIFMQDAVAPGLPFWLENGETLLRVIKDYIHSKMKDRYERIITPIMAKTELWQRSGHYEMYRDNMFVFQVGKEEYALKPMSCPLHVVVIKKRKLLKAQLPVRLAEYGQCHRNEASGALNGLLRARCLTQDDAHIFCIEEQIEDETMQFCQMLEETYKAFGMSHLKIFLATRPEKFIGLPETWNRAEEYLASAIKKAGHDFEIKQGDGAFYGPKLEFHVKDNLGRLWQCGTAQLDFMMAERLDLTYDDQGQKRHPVIIHHAILGSLERFAGILLEQSKGWLPMWLAPIQILLIQIKAGIDITDIMTQLQKNKIRYKVDNGKDSLSDRIKKSYSLKIPAVIAIGEREIESKVLPVRLNGAKEVKMTLQNLMELVTELPK